MSSDFDLAEFLSKCLSARSRSLEAAEPAGTPMAMRQQQFTPTSSGHVATETDHSIAAQKCKTAPTVEGLMELLSIVADECRGASQDDTFSSAFVSRFGEFASMYDNRGSLSEDKFQMTRKIAVGSSAEIFLVALKSAPSVPCVMKRMMKARLISQPRSVCFWEERDLLVEATKKLVSLKAADRTISKAGYEGLIRLKFAFHDLYAAYLVTDFYPGGDLCALCDKYESFSEDMARFYIAETAMAIAAIHSLGYAHRDIKPDNIFLDARGHVHLGDFGSCAKIDRSGLVEASDRTLAFNNPEYIAPEVMQAMHGDISTEYGSECDWWSLGIVLYEMLHGNGPFEAETFLEIRQKVMHYEEHLKFGSVKLTLEAEDLLRKLICLKADRLKGLTELMNHPFFKSVNWTNLRDSKAPFVPELSSLSDTSLFEVFEEDCNSNASSPTPSGSSRSNSLIPPSSRSNSLSKSSGPSFATTLRLPFIGYEYCLPAESINPKVETPKNRMLRRRSSGPLDLRFKKSLVGVASHLSFVETPERAGLSNNAEHASTKIESTSKQESNAASLVSKSVEDETKKTARRSVRFTVRDMFLDGAKNGEIDLVKSLYEDGANDIDIEDTTATGMTALLFAADVGNLELVKYLVEQGADVNAAALDGCTSLHLAVLEELEDLTKYLLECGANVNAVNHDGELPIDIAESEPVQNLLSSYSSQDSKTSSV